MDLTLPLRKAAVSRLKADGALPHVPEAQIFGMRSKGTLTWPFTRYGTPDTGAAGAGSVTDFTVHAFSKATFEDECAEICAGIKAKLSGAVLALEDGDDTFKAHLSWRRTQIIPDSAEADAWHGIVHFMATISVCA